EMGRKAKLGPFPELHRNLDTFFDSIWIVDHRFNYLVGYRERPTLAPVGMLMGHILWEEPEPYFLDLWRRYLRTPRSVAGGNLYTLYYGVRVAILLEQGIPEPWRTHVFKLAKAQVQKGSAAGAFRKVRWNGRGEVLTTALAVLTLEHALFLR
ncbi:MAG: hypothetical protein ACYSUN_10865, partial [Planctomycetota bacterium]